MITVRMQGHPDAPLLIAFGTDDKDEVELLVFADVKSGIAVEVMLTSENRRQLLAALERRPVIQTASRMPAPPGVG